MPCVSRKVCAKHVVKMNNLDEDFIQIWPPGVLLFEGLPYASLCNLSLPRFTNGGAHVPRILPCHHTICEACLLGIAQAADQRLFTLRVSYFLYKGISKILIFGTLLHFNL